MIISTFYKISLYGGRLPLWVPKEPLAWKPLGAPLLTWIFPAWISNNMLSKVQDEITYPFPNFKVWKWMCNFVPHFIMDIIIYPGSKGMCRENADHKAVQDTKWTKRQSKWESCNHIRNNGFLHIKYLIKMTACNIWFIALRKLTHYTPWWHHDMETISALPAPCEGKHW